MIYYILCMIPISTYLFLISENKFWKFFEGLVVVLCILAVALHIATH